MWCARTFCADIQQMRVMHGMAASVYGPLAASTLEYLAVQTMRCAKKWNINESIIGLASYHTFFFHFLSKLKRVRQPECCSTMCMWSLSMPRYLL